MLIKSQKITLWTIQHQDFYKTLIQEKIVYAALRPEIDSEYLTGYEWLRKQMDNKIGKRPFPTCYPIWAWYQWNGIQQAKPDLRYSCHLNKGTPGVRLTIYSKRDQRGSIIRFHLVALSLLLSLLYCCR
ncbi:DUF3841 domain-containing protein [Acinetobacter schindleri]|nr:DUF3841 domain-containing protein [Acinetobacter schindleri]